MSSTITAYRVFVASPSGLESERELFRTAINEYNEADAIERGVVFLPLGWEQSPAGVGRPQQTINGEVRRSDFFLLLLHDRWGSAPQAAPGPFTSGSQEEFSVAQECYANKTMREIVVFFKGVDQGKLADPGDELKPVLEFKKRLEAEKELLFENFDVPENFKYRLQRQLARWVRDHEQRERGQSPSGAFPPPAEEDAVARGPSEPAVDVPIATGSAAVRDATTLAQQGHVTQAEQALVQVIAADQKPNIDDDTLEALISYGGLQLQQGNLASAQKVFDQLRTLAHDQGKVEWEIAALNSLAKASVEAGTLDQAEMNYRAIISIQEQVLGPNHPHLAGSLNNLAKLFATQRRSEEAEPLFRRALDLQGISIDS
jgi:tetratricopeptide (TPR) repeat protein